MWVISNCFIDVYQTWLISNLITILPDLVPFLIRVNKFMEINQMWVISNCFIDVYQTWLISNLITILPDLVPFLIGVNKFMEINQMWVISNSFYRCLPDLVDF